MSTATKAISNGKGRSQKSEPYRADDRKTLKTRKRRQGFHDELTSFWFLLPILVTFVVLFAVPLCETFYFSLTDFNGYSMNMKFVGLDNYKTAFSDPSIMQGLRFTIAYALITTVVITVIEVPLAVALNKKFVGRNFCPLGILLLLSTLYGDSRSGVEVHFLTNEQRSRE